MQGTGEAPRRVFSRVPTGERMARAVASGELPACRRHGSTNGSRWAWAEGYMQALFDQGHLTAEAWEDRMEAIYAAELGEGRPRNT